MVNLQLEALVQQNLSTSAGSGRDKDAPIPDWVRAVAMIGAKDKQAIMESKRQLPEEFSARDFDVVRARALSSQI